MRIAVSNIAWPADQDLAVADALCNLGVSGVEIAPTKVWAAPLEATDAEIDSYRQFWESRGISIVAAQALLFGRPDLTLFETAEARRQTLEYLQGIIRVCARMGAMSLVFGAPRNRLVRDRDRTAVWQEAVGFFGELGELAAAERTAIVLEANPREYGADFVIQADEALQLVRAVNHPGFRLHLDTACMFLAGDSPSSIIPAAAGYLSHVHASEPQLAPIGQGPVDHDSFATLLTAANYRGWVSVEMRQVDPFDILQLQQAILRAIGAYGA